jgi:hypothetical protein
VDFIDVLPAFKEHGCGGASEWINCAVPDLGDPGFRESFHPQLTGHRAYAHEVVLAI